jgi:hypothetical protein
VEHGGPRWGWSFSNLEAKRLKQSEAESFTKSFKSGARLQVKWRCSWRRARTGSFGEPERELDNTLLYLL